MDLDQELHPHGAGEAAERFPGRGVVTPFQAGHDRLGNPGSLRQCGLGKPVFGPVLDDLDGDRSRQGGGLALGAERRVLARVSTPGAWGGARRAARLDVMAAMATE
jgi:hypothetical protein